MFGARWRTPCSSLPLSAPSLLLACTLAACSQQPAPASPEAAPAAAQPEPAATAPAGAASAAAAPAPSGSPGLTQHTGASLFVVHLISDFAAFQKYFEDGAAQRQAAGIEGHLLTRLDDGRVVIHFFAKDAAKVQAALNSEDLQRYLNRGGAPDSSLVWVTRDELVFLPSKPPAVPTFSLYLKRRTRDFAGFRKAFEQRTTLFSKQGMLAFGLHQSSSQPETVVLHFMGSSKASLEALSSLAEFRELMALTEETDTKKPLIGEDVSRSRPQ
jgi:hypothetical protein